MTTTVTAALIAWLGAWPGAWPATVLGAAPAKAARPTRAVVEMQLRAAKGAPARASLSAAGPGVDALLVEIAGDAKAELSLRARAVAALGGFATPPARRFLEQTIDGKIRSSEASDRLLLRNAAVALGWLGGTTVPAKIGPLLDNPDPDVRIDAAVALGLTRLPAAADLLRTHLADEPVDRVRAQMGRQLQAIEAALVEPPGTPRDR